MKFILMTVAAVATACPPDLEQSILAITGASMMEELEQSEIERFTNLADHPLCINSVSRSKMLASGLFSCFQVASICDSRSRTGDILSLSELSLLEGFSEEKVSVLSRFISFKSGMAPGDRRRLAACGSVMARIQYKKGEETAFLYGTKCEVSLGNTAELYWSTRTTTENRKFDLGTLSAAYYGCKWLGKVVVGNYNARFGQGLVCWSSFSMSGLPSTSSFRKNGSGFSTTGSFSSTLRGVAADMNFGRWVLSAAMDIDGNPIAAVNWNGRRLSLGATGTLSKWGMDWKLGIGDVSCYGELAWGNGPAGIAGVSWTPQYKTELSLLVRCYSEAYLSEGSGAIRMSGKCRDESAVSLGIRHKNISSTVDLSSRTSEKWWQVKSKTNFCRVVETGGKKLGHKFDANFRYNSATNYPIRTSLRGAVDVTSDILYVCTAAELLYSRNFAWMTEAECGIVDAGPFSIYLKSMLFDVKYWDDRIYVYERDAPDNFNLHCCYGRGLHVSSFVAVKKFHSPVNWTPEQKLYLKFAFTAYYQKASNFEAKVQYAIRF